MVRRGKRRVERIADGYGGSHSTGGLSLSTSDSKRIIDLAQYNVKKQCNQPKKNHHKAVRLSDMSREAVRQSAEACKDENN